MKISLSPEIERLIADKLQSGRYRSADEVVRQGLELLEKQENRVGSPWTPAGNLAKSFEDLRRQVPDSEWERVPADLSKNLDHYLYGGPKTS